MDVGVCNGAGSLFIIGSKPLLFGLGSGVKPLPPDATPGPPFGVTRGSMNSLLRGVSNSGGKASTGGVGPFGTRHVPCGVWPFGVDTHGEHQRFRGLNADVRPGRAGEIGATPLAPAFAVASAELPFSAPEPFLLFVLPACPHLPPPIPPMPPAPGERGFVFLLGTEIMSGFRHLPGVLPREGKVDTTLVCRSPIGFSFIVSALTEFLAA